MSGMTPTPGMEFYFQISVHSREERCAEGAFCVHCVTSRQVLFDSGNVYFYQILQIILIA